MKNSNFGPVVGRASLGVLVLLLGAPDSAIAYRANCSPTVGGGPAPFVTTDIPSVFGEARGTSCDSGCVPNRFHNGLDIANNCGEDHFVFPIVAGTATLVVPSVPNCNSGNVKCLRVRSGANFFDYIHVDPTGRVVENQYVLTTTTLGVIQPLNVDGNHLHLNDGSAIGTTLILFNPQFQGRIDYTDADRPTFASATIGGLTREVVLVRDGTQASPAALTFRNGKFYAGGDVDIIATVRNGADRKGVYRVWADVWPIQLSSNTFFPGNSSLEFGLLKDSQGDAQDVQRVYYRRQAIATGDSYIPTNFFTGPISPQAVNGRWATFYATQGQQQVCVYAHDHPPPSPHQAKSCVDVVVDNALPSLNVTGPGAVVSNGSIYSSSTTITLEGVDVGGIERFELTGAFSTTTYIDGVEASTSVTHQNLPTGSYQVAVYDLAGNVTSVAFQSVTAPISSLQIENGSDALLSGYVSSTNSLRITAIDNNAGICSITHGSQPSTMTFVGASTATWGLIQGISHGSHTVTAYNCAGSSTSFQYFFSTAAVDSMQMCASSTSMSCTTRTPNDETILKGNLTIEVDVGDPCPADWRNKAYLTVEGLPANQEDAPNCRQWRAIGPPARSAYFQLANISTAALGVSYAIVGIVKYVNEHRADLGFSSSSLDLGGVVLGTVTIADVGQDFTVSATSVTFVSQLKNLSLSVVSWTNQVAQAFRQGLYPLGGARSAAGSDFSLTAQGTMTFTNTDPGGQPAVTTSTLKVYAWTGSTWTLTGINQLNVAIAGSLITSSATISRSGTYAMLFSVNDASAPRTSWSIQGSSSGFAGATFVSTYSYLVLSSTDPTVNGFASGLATTYYRIDRPPGDAFTAYSSSLSFLPGTHWVDYYAVDWAGNVEAVKRATITVTAGSVTKLSGDLQVDGNLLVGFLGTSAKAEVVARAEYDYALMVSSVDGRAMLAVDNANFASIGTAPASGRLTLAGVSQDTALALRSGNSTAAVTGAQIAFGYDGASDLRHALYTQHGSADYNNKMVFKLWTPATGSSVTLGNLPVLSLEGSSKTAAGALVHIMPAGLGQNELVVSNGAGLGLGNVQRWERWQPSASIFKTGIERLGVKDEAAAWADVMALRPARYRRKVKGANAPLERGYIFEEIPASIRAGTGAISVDERLVNAELVLQAAIREMNTLEARLKKLQAGRR